MMTIEQCYQALGGSFTEVSMRLPSVRLVEKFIGKFLDDGSFDELCRQMATGSRQEAFRAAHTLKGVCANLGFGRLLSSSSRLTELLRPESDSIPTEAAALMEEVREDYRVTIAAIRAYLEKP